MDPHFGEGDPQWEADVPAAADYAYRRFHLEESFPQIRFWHFGTVHYTIGRRCQPTIDAIVEQLSNRPLMERAGTGHFGLRSPCVPYLEDRHANMDDRRMWSMRRPVHVGRRGRSLCHYRLCGLLHLSRDVMTVHACWDPTQVALEPGPPESPLFTMACRRNISDSRKSVDDGSRRPCQVPRW